MRGYSIKNIPWTPVSPNRERGRGRRLASLEVQVNIRALLLLLRDFPLRRDSLLVLSSFPDEVKRALGFSLRQLQIGREPTSQTRNMSSIRSGVYELKEADERVWFRAIYLSKVGNTIYVLHGFEKDSRKTDRRGIEVASERLKLVRQRLQEQRAHEKRSRK